MEIIILRENVKEKLSIQVTDFKKLSDDVVKNPEGYVFILSPDEYRRYKEYQTAVFNGGATKLRELSETIEKDITLTLLVITMSPITIQSMRPYVVPDMPPSNNYPGGVVFFAKRSDGTHRLPEIRRILSDNIRLHRDASNRN